MKIKVVYDTGEVTVDIPDAEIAALVARKEREGDALLVASAEKDRQKRKLIRLEVVK